MSEAMTTGRMQLDAEAEKTLSRFIDASGPEPLIRGTTIEAYRIAALTAGMGLDEILYDYPSLAEDQVLAAKAYADATPNSGRPFPSMTAKKGMRMARDVTEFLPTRE